MVYRRPMVSDIYSVPGTAYTVDVLMEKILINKMEE